jgi:hypothetical protein
MAVTRASNSGTTGTKSRDASGGTTKITDLPGAPTLGTVTVVGTTATIPVTANQIGGIPTLFTATSNPGGLTATSAGTSPINFPSLSAGTTYTFTVTGSSTAGTGVASAPSNEITTGSPPPTVYYVIVGGGSNSSSAGGGGVVQDANYSMTGITSFGVTVGSAAGTSTFNGINASPGSGTTSGNGFTQGGGAGWHGGGGNGGGGGAGGNGAGAFGTECYDGNGYNCHGGYGGNGGPGAAVNIHGSTTYYGAGGGGNASMGYNFFLPHGGGGTGTGGSGANTGGPGSSGRVMVAYGTQYGPLTVGPGLTFTQDTSTRANHRVYTFTAGTGTVIV